MRKLCRKIDDRTLGKILIIKAIRMEGQLADLIKVELRAMRKRMKQKNNDNYEDLISSNKIIKQALSNMEKLDGRVQEGLELMKRK